MIKVKIEEKDFFEKVLPVLRESGHFQGKIYTVEGIEHPCMRFLDFSGFDYFMHNEDGTIDGLSVRICYQDYSTFTIRKSAGAETEYSKHKKSIEMSKMRPYWHIQAYIIGGEVKRIAFAVKDNLIDYISKGNRYDVRGGQETFFSINWDDFEKAGYPIWKLDLKKGGNK